MPVAPTYPGVYIEEIPSGVRTITGVATSITAFVGRALRGPVNEPITINSYGDYERVFGGLWVSSAMSFAVRDFYQNGGGQAIIVRLFERLPAAAQTAATDAADAAKRAPTGSTATAVTQLARGVANNFKTGATNADPAKFAGANAVATAAETASTGAVVTAALAQAAAMAASAGPKSAGATAAADAAKNAPAGSTVTAVAQAARDVANNYRTGGSKPDQDKFAGADAVATAAETAAIGAVVTAAQSAVTTASAAAKPGATLAADAAKNAPAGSTATAVAKAARDVANNFKTGATNADPAKFAGADAVATAAETALTGAVPAVVSAALAVVTALAASAVAKSAAATLAADAAKNAPAGSTATAVAQAARDVANSFKTGATNADPDKFAGADAVATAAETALTGAVAAVVSAALAAAQAVTTGKALLNVGGLSLEATSEGFWGSKLHGSVDVPQTVDQLVLDRLGVSNGDVFNLTVDTGQGGTTETFRNLTVKNSSRRVDKVLIAESRLVRWSDPYPSTPPTFSTATANASPATDGSPLTILDVAGSESDKTGIFALEKADLFNLLCIPPFIDESDTDTSLLARAAVYCEKRRAMFLIDSPFTWKSKELAKSGVSTLGTSKNTAVYFPWLVEANPLHENQLENFPPCGAVAGIFARTDATRGVWKAPAGLDATLTGVPKLSVSLTDAENGELNPLGINCLRTMPAAGRLVWGARTLQGNDQLASEWKYVPVRRTALFLEESLYRGTQWVVFEPNDEPLWAQIRLNIGAFLHNLFRQGAFQGKTPREAYFVKCDKETTTQNDINLGIVNIVVGFAPLKPAEFVIIKIQQMAGQIEV